MKTKIALGVVVLLVIAVFTGNWIYGNKIAKEIDNNLQPKLSDSKLPVSISYSDIAVNPMFSKIVFSDLEVSNRSDITFTSEEIELKIPAKEALRIAESPEINDLKSFKIQLKEAAFKPNNLEKGVTVENLTIDFSGHLTKEVFENLEHEFPTEKQSLELSFTDLNINDLGIGKTPQLLELQNQISYIDEGKFKVAFLPDSKEIIFEELKLSSPVLNSKSKVVLNYSGTGADNFKMLSADAKTDYVLTPKDVHIEDGDGSYDLSLKQLVVSTDFTLNLEKSSLPVGKISFLSEGLKTKSNGSASSVISLPIPGGASLNDLEIEKLAINYELKGDNLTISNTELSSSLIAAFFNAEITIDNDNTSNSVIKNAKLTVNKLSPELESFVAMLEGQMGKEFPRENDKITLEITGNLGSPKIKGLEF